MADIDQFQFTTAAAAYWDSTSEQSDRIVVPSSLPDAARLSLAEGVFVLVFKPDEQHH